LSREQWQRTRPALTPGNALVLDVWAWCGGWNPALIPAAAAWHDIEDLDMLVELLLTLRELTGAKRKGGK
jgi:hypothetical protein